MFGSLYVINFGNPVYLCTRSMYLNVICDALAPEFLILVGWQFLASYNQSPQVSSKIACSAVSAIYNHLRNMYPFSIFIGHMQVSIFNSLPKIS